MKVRGSWIAALLVAGCATPSNRIAGALERYGFDPARSQCVGDRLGHDLSLGQLSQLGQAASAFRRGDSDPSRLTPDDLIRAGSEIHDPAIPLAIGKALALCGAAPSVR